MKIGISILILKEILLFSIQIYHFDCRKLRLLLLYFRVFLHFYLTIVAYCYQFSTQKMVGTSYKDLVFHSLSNTFANKLKCIVSIFNYNQLQLQHQDLIFHAFGAPENQFETSRFYVPANDIFCNVPQSVNAAKLHYTNLLLLVCSILKQQSQTENLSHLGLCFYRNWINFYFLFAILILSLQLKASIFIPSFKVSHFL